MLRSSSLGLLLVLLPVLPACGDDHDGTGDELLQDDASDEVLLAMRDKVMQGMVTVDNARAAQLTAPAAGAMVPGATPVAFTWSLPSMEPGGLRHGTATGKFVWLNIDGPGIANPVDVLSITTTTFTPDATSWASMVHASGAITVTLTTATAADGVITQGPYRPSANPTFTVAQ